MSLISQNASTKNVVNKSKREVEDDVENSDTLKVKKKKKYDEGEQLAMEQVKEMKKLENFLFGSLYSPLEFGKEEDEVEPPKAAEKVSDLFFTDRSADSVLTVYREEDADLSEGSHDDDDRALQKKQLCIRMELD